jgi:uncharacterized protein (DUF2237 family)
MADSKGLEQKNVLGEPIQACCFEPKTGYFRDGFCRTGKIDHGKHVVCAIMTDEFLQYSRARGNDLITPVPEYGFPGLTAGDKWCLCVTRWREAFNAGVTPQVDLAATHESALEYVTLDALKSHQLMTN